MVVWLIALLPAFFVFAAIVASEKKSTVWWATFWGLVVAAVGPAAYFLLDAGAVLIAAWLGWYAQKQAYPENPAPQDKSWPTRQPLDPKNGSYKSRAEVMLARRQSLLAAARAKTTASHQRAHDKSEPQED